MQKNHISYSQKKKLLAVVIGLAILLGGGSWYYQSHWATAPVFSQATDKNSLSKQGYQEIGIDTGLIWQLPSAWKYAKRSTEENLFYLYSDPDTQIKIRQEPAAKAPQLAEEQTKRLQSAKREVTSINCQMLTAINGRNCQGIETKLAIKNESSGKKENYHQHTWVFESQDSQTGKAYTYLLQIQAKPSETEKMLTIINSIKQVKTS